MKKLISIISLLLLLSACSDSEYIDTIRLTDQHLENIPAGSWLHYFNLDYSSGKELRIQIKEKLKNEGELLDKTISNEGNSSVMIYTWEFKGLRIKEENYYNYGSGDGTWIEIRFKEPKLYSDLLPIHYDKLNPNRKLEHTVTISSKKDDELRLFLFGKGKYCEKIRLF